jgi:hypothetical protein
MLNILKHEMTAIPCVITNISLGLKSVTKTNNSPTDARDFFNKPKNSQKN